MTDLDRRIERLERRTGVKCGPRTIYITPNLESEDPEETPYLVKLSTDLWANVYGEPLSDDGVRKLRQEYKQDHPKQFESVVLK